MAKKQGQTATLVATIELPEEQTDVTIALPELAEVTSGGVSEPPAPPVPDGYAARVIVLPEQYWRIFDRQAARGKLTVSAWLELLLRHMARE